MIKILFFIEELRGGGAEKVLCNLVNEMDQSKFEITVHTLWKADAARYLKPGIRYRCCYANESKLNNWRNRLECGATKIMAGSTNRKAKKIAWVHCDLALKMADPEVFVKKASPWYQKFDRIVCVSQNVKDIFDRMFGLKTKSLVLYNTVDDAEIRRKADVHLQELPAKRRLTAVTLGRLTHQKAYDRLLRVHKALLENNVEYDLWILGDGEQRPELERYISKHGLMDSVRLFGFCENPYPFIRAADLLVCSSRYEGFSTFITEGVILGKPIVTTDCTGMRELLGDSEYGLITNNTEEDLLQGMERMLLEPDLRDHYAARSKLRGQDFSAGKLTAKTEQFFCDLIEDGAI